MAIIYSLDTDSDPLDIARAYVAGRGIGLTKLISVVLDEKTGETEEREVSLTDEEILQKFSTDMDNWILNNARAGYEKLALVEQQTKAKTDSGLFVSALFAKKGK